MDKLPNGWNLVKFSEVVYLRHGHQFRKHDFVENGIPVIKIGQCKIDGTLDLSDCDFIDNIRLNEFEDYQICKGDLLMALTGGTLGKVTFVDKDYGIVVQNYRVGNFFPINNQTTKEFVRYILLSDIFQNLVADKVNQGAQPNIGKDSIDNMLIPFPPLPEQKRIVSKLDALFERIDKSIALLEEIIKQTEHLMASALVEVFEKELINVSRKPLNDVAIVARGKSKHRPRNDKRLFGGAYPFIQTGDVRNAKKYIKSYKNGYSEFGLSQSKLWKKNTICLTIAANIGDVAILAIDACFPDSVVGITSDKMHHEFLYYYLKTLQRQLDKMANSAAQKNINLKILSSIEVPVPNFTVQKAFGDRISKIENIQTKIIKEQNAKLANLKALKESVLDKAFKGEL